MNLRSKSRWIVCLAWAVSVDAATPILLDVPEVTQEQTEWCWAGSTNAVLRYYKTPLKQCEIAEYTRTQATFHDFGSVDCCTSPSGACNYWNYNWGQPGSMQDILSHWGVQNKGVGGTLSLSQVRTELEARRPIIVRWAYKTSGGHFVVGHGLTDSSLHYMDPWPGEGLKIAKFSWVVSNSQKDWAGTNVMTTTPVSSIAPRSPPAPPLARLSNSGNTLIYHLEAESTVDLAIVNLQGEILWIATGLRRPTGLHEEPIASRLPAGPLLVRIRTGDREIDGLLLRTP